MKVQKSNEKHFSIPNDGAINITCTVKTGKVTLNLFEKVIKNNVKEFVSRGTVTVDATKPNGFTNITKKYAGAWKLEVWGIADGESEFSLSGDVKVGTS